MTTVPSLAVGRLGVHTVVERAGPTRPTWLLPDAGPEALARHRDWLAPWFLDERDRFLTVLGTHFHRPTAGRIVRHGGSWRFRVADAR
jgi:hypothetical protein